MAKTPEEKPVKDTKDTAIEADETKVDAPVDSGAPVSPDAPADAPAEGTTEDGAPAKVVRKKKNRRTVTAGQIHVLATFNNTIITITDDKGNTLATGSAGASASASCGLTLVGIVASSSMLSVPRISAA